MSQPDCIFCKITVGEIPAYTIYEDGDFMAFLDIFPSHYGQTLVVPKQHYTSRFSDTDINILQKLVVAGQKVAKKLEDKLNAERCIIVIEGLELDHLHLKLYPALQPEPIKHAVTKGGEKAADDELQKLLEKIND